VGGGGGQPIRERGGPMSNHTPGPWVVHHDADCKEIEITTEDGRTIAFMFGNHPQDIADAHLIRVAPEMFDLLVEIRDNHAIDEMCGWASDKIDALIAKAKGKA
jgi:hypothetical protein